MVGRLRYSQACPSPSLSRAVLSWYVWRSAESQLLWYVPPFRLTPRVHPALCMASQLLNARTGGLFGVGPATVTVTASGGPGIGTGAQLPSVRGALQAGHSRIGRGPVDLGAHAQSRVRGTPARLGGAWHLAQRVPLPGTLARPRASARLALETGRTRAQGHSSRRAAGRRGCDRGPGRQAGGRIGKGFEPRRHRG